MDRIGKKIVMSKVLIVLFFSLQLSKGLEKPECLAVRDSSQAKTAIDDGKITLEEFASCPARTTDFKTAPSEAPNSGWRANGLADFCLILEDEDSDPVAFPDPSDYGGPLDKDDENHPTQQLLMQLLKLKGAWSNQMGDNLPFSIGDSLNNFANFSYPEHGAHNPYYIETTGISVKGDLLHNWLHFRVFLNRSESLGFDLDSANNIAQQDDRGKTLNKEGSREKPDNARGRITAMLMMVKDQDGWPIGDFSQDIPCRRTCSHYPEETYYGSKSNAVPCAYTPPRASSHPGMFVFDAHPGFYADDELTTHRPGKLIIIEESSTTPETTTTDTPSTTTTVAGPAPAPAPPPAVTTTTAGSTTPTLPTPPPLEFPVPETSRKSVREVHATWTFNQNTCNFVSKIYIQTLILEDIRYTIPGKLDPNPGVTPRPPPPPPKNAGNDRPKLFGWTAQYNILHPTKSSLGAADYVDLKYLKKRDLEVAEVDCHVPMFDAPKTFPNGFLKGQVPQNTPTNQIPIPSVKPYLLALRAVLGPADGKTPSPGAKHVQYYGQHDPEVKCNSQGDKIVEDAGAKKSVIPTVSEFMLEKDNVGVRCPCPQIPSTLPPENRTVDPTRTHARLIHASHMAIAYMLLTPLACFVARYYKETFVTVFCFQEYWWYMWHVVILIIACVFNFGAVLSIVRRKDTELKLSDNVIVHKILGSMSIFVFYMEIFTGFFRVADPQKRLRQIFMHWLIGCMNNVCAVGSMFAMAWVDQSGMSCSTVYTIIIWLLFVVTCYVIMELDMRRTDKKLALVPKRSYLPPPIVRLFNRDAPGRNFRMIMLGIFITGLIILQLLVSYYIWHSGGDSCSQEYEKFHEQDKEFDESAEDGGEEGPDDYIAE